MVFLIVSLSAFRGSKAPRIGNSDVNVRLSSGSSLVWVCDASLFQGQELEHYYIAYIQDKGFRSSASSRPVPNQLSNDLGMKHRLYHYCKRLNTCQRGLEQKSFRVQCERILEVCPCYTIGLMKGSGFRKIDPAS